MPIPSSVQKVLDKWNVEFALTEAAALPPARLSNQGNNARSSAIVQVVFLQDSQGTVQVVVPTDRLVDLNLIAHQLGRRFKAVSPENLERIKVKLGLDDFPALPQLTNLDSLIDRSLLDRDDLFIQSGSGNHWLKIPKEQFRILTANSIVGRFSSPLQLNLLQQDFDQDLQDIHQAVRQFTPLRIQQRLAETLDLPPLPETARKIIDLKIDEYADTMALVEAIESDPSMSAQVISWARSSLYGSRPNINNVEDAVLRVMGFDLVMNLALGLALGQTVAVPKEGPRGYQSFWLQAVVGASLAGKVAPLCKGKNKVDSGHAYLCGLLHNFGYLILGHAFPPQFSLINRHVEANPHVNRMYVERHLLGVSREQVAACLMKNWLMPDQLVIALKHQHNPIYSGENSQYSQLLYVVTRSLRMQGFGDGPKEAIDPSVCEALKLDEQLLEDTTVDLLDKLNELQGMARMIEEA
ncbi:MAG: HDOD domain-containing protein [Oceanobacter sp.]